MKLSDHLFNIEMGNQPAPGSGKLLIAEPFLREPYFNHAVVMMVDGDGAENESMGVVLNIDSDNSLQSLIGGIEREEPIDVFCGGPLGLDRLFFLHTLGDVISNSQQINDTGIYVGGDFTDVIDYINSGYPLEGHVRFFVGYSGWSAGQLDDEISKNVWAVVNPAEVGTPAMLLTDRENSYWHRTVNALGDRFKTWRMFPKDLRSN